MNDNLLAEEIAEVLKADSVFASLFIPAAGEPPSIHAAQSGEITVRPTLTLAGAHMPYLTRRKGTLSFELRTRLADEAAAGESRHDALFDALWTKFFGAQGADDAATRANQAAARTALIAAVAARGKVTIASYGPAVNAVEADAQEADLRTVLTLMIAWQFAPPV